MDSKRLNGLDSLRAIAILLVLMTHYRGLVSHEDTFGFLTEVGWTGVDLFFVLSGYLIGNQLLSVLAKGGDFSLRLFYTRRLLRTLPNYYVVLAIYFLFPLALTGVSRSPLWEFLTFTQNFSLRPDQTFTHSWSLCIEEQFYLFVPALVLLAFRKTSNVNWVWGGMACVFFLAMLNRAYMWYSLGGSAMTDLDNFQYIYYSSFSRFDGLVPGVAIALLKNFYPQFFSRCLARGNYFFVVGLVCTLFAYSFSMNYIKDEHGYTASFAIFGFPAIAISYTLLLIAALSPQTLLYKIAIPGAGKLAIWSYAIYLIHKPLFAVLAAPVATAGVDVRNWYGVVIIWGVSIFAGWLLFILVETPFMRIRTKYFPSNCKQTNTSTLTREMA